MAFRSMLKLTTKIRSFRGVVEREIHSKICTLHPDLEKAFNHQINAEFYASYTYLAMVVSLAFALPRFAAVHKNCPSGHDGEVLESDFAGRVRVAGCESVRGIPWFEMMLFQETTSSRDQLPAPSAAKEVIRANFFAKQSVCLLGLHKLFMGNVLEEREHAHKLIDYLNKRGSNVVLDSVAAPNVQSWDSPLAAFKDALELEKCISEKIFSLHKLCENLCDVSACTLLENDFIESQVEEYDKISRYIAQLERIGPEGLGIYIFDRYLQKDNK